MLLLLEDVSPNFISPEIQISCLIHVGWPADFYNCECKEIPFRCSLNLVPRCFCLDSTQVSNHKAPISILVANAPDMQMFSSGSQIVLQTSPCSQNIFTHPEQLGKLRETFGILLEKVSTKSKEQLYMVNTFTHLLRFQITYCEQRARTGLSVMVAMENDLYPIGPRLNLPIAPTVICVKHFSTKKGTNRRRFHFFGPDTLHITDFSPRLRREF